LVGLHGRGISPAPRPLSTQDNTTQRNRHTSMPRAGFEPAIPMFERPKAVLPLDRAATETGRLLPLEPKYPQSVWDLKLWRQWRSICWSSGFWRRVVLCGRVPRCVTTQKTTWIISAVKTSNVSYHITTRRHIPQDHETSLPWKPQIIHQEALWYPTTSLHSVETHKTTTWTLNL
jgi:hypothetical protein